MYFYYQFKAHGQEEGCFVSYLSASKCNTKFESDSWKHQWYTDMATNWAALLALPSLWDKPTKHDRVTLYQHQDNQRANPTPWKPVFTVYEHCRGFIFYSSGKKKGSPSFSSGPHGLLLLIHDCGKCYPSCHKITQLKPSKSTWPHSSLCVCVIDPITGKAHTRPQGRVFECN